MSDFTWIPEFGSSADSEVAVESSQLGDGYVAEIPDGLNPMKQTFPLSFTRPTAEIADIEAFLRAKMGAIFTWTPPDGTEIMVVCKKWSKRWDKPGWAVLTASFERRYG